MQKHTLQVSIIGGGIGGLFAANALRAHDIAVSVYEQAPALGEIGAGVFLTPNSVRHLRRLGLEQAVEKFGARVGPASKYYRQDGSVIAPVRVTDSNGWNATFGMHRADLVTLLSEALPEGVVNTGHKCVDFAQSSHGARVTFENGAVADADVVIAADGIHSALRPFVYPPSKPVFSGSVAYRGVVPRKRLPHWADDVWQMWLGKGKHFLTFPLRRGELINFVGFVPADQEMKESWSAVGDPDALRAEFSTWHARLQELLAVIDSTFRWALYDRDPLQTWTVGRLTLLGDAAHPMLPHLGQGANQSIEDGMALATVLSRVGSADLSAALVAYEKIRRKRVAEVQLGARQNGMRYDSAYDDINRRDSEIQAHADFRRSLYDYDVVNVANEIAIG